MKKLYRIGSSFLVLLLIFILNKISAQTQPPFTPAAERLKVSAQRQKLRDQSLINQIPFRNVGPAVMSGRVVDVDVNPKDPSVFYVAYASGGLWKTTSNGSDFTPLFDQEAVMTIGDIAVNWDKNIIWVGTGENNSSRSSYAGAASIKVLMAEKHGNTTVWKKRTTSGASCYTPQIQI
ncbi:MAG: hypothetical protein HC817_10520 [Saprospiraceae bacterium]|nr:hypothetical protein [Saprospiraceae bacterium]